MFHVLFALPWLYVVTRTVAPLPWDVAIKIAVSVALLAGAQFHYWSRLSSGSVFTPEFPRPLILLFNWIFGAIALLAVFQIGLDLAALVALAAGGAGSDVWIEGRYAIAAVAFVLAALGVRQAVRVPRLRDVTIAVPGLPAAFDGYTLVQLTDLHISRLFPEAWTRAVVDATNRLEPNLIVVTGDVIDGSVAMRRADVEPLRGLRAADGVYLIPGNHEYLSGYAAWMAHLGSLGMRILANAHAVIRHGGDSLVLAGVTDPSARRANLPPPDLDRALAGRPTGAPVVLLDHEPGRARQAAERGVAFQLSGHTHGGMILGLHRLVARANGGFVSGRYAVDGMTLYVNNGTGIWPGFALRLGKPSELTRFTLQRRDA
ncbi:metallophosphoesterase [Sphingomonas sp. AP4-R1]|uniref:metallophosphoesterase n=1 Tax=Sphingomonas sp. AP4-R1 TaxID=2735134 RepID=UPI00149339E9|nr:metallophosphoesterase [Sphingomonas sp. AP4-R1]QJU60128.1 metallophosphoesterase [Sphingomonas sp. AP4-R1]